MNAIVDEDIRNAWNLDHDRTRDLIATETRRAHEKAAGVGRTGTAFAASELSKALCPAVEAKAQRLILRTKAIFEAHGEEPTAADDGVLRQRLQQLLESESSDVLAAIQKANVGETPVTRMAQQELERVRSRFDQDMKLMLVSLRTTAAAKAQTSMNIRDSTVQIGNYNVQNNQVTVFRDIVAQIDASQHTEAEKAAAKSKVTELLTHPVIVSVVGAIAEKVFRG